MPNLLNEETKQSYSLLKKALNNEELNLSRENKKYKNLSLKEIEELELQKLLNKILHVYKGKRISNII